MNPDIPEETVTTPEPTNVGGKTIVLAEDDPFISRMYQTKLVAAGYNVLVCKDGREAFEQIKFAHPDFVMLDINMPELTGFQVYKGLQSAGYDFSATHVVVLTNSGDPADRKEAATLGLDFIVKADMTPKSVLEYIDQKLK